MSGAGVVVVGQDDEAGLVGGVVLDAAGEDLDGVDFGGAAGADGGGGHSGGQHIRYGGDGA